jgi:hypothetical protein
MQYAGNYHLPSMQEINFHPVYRKLLFTLSDRKLLFTRPTAPGALASTMMMRLINRRMVDPLSCEALEPAKLGASTPLLHFST